MADKSPSGPRHDRRQDRGNGPSDGHRSISLRGAWNKLAARTNRNSSILAMLVSVRKIIFLSAGILFVALAIAADEYQKRVDSCDITLTEDDIKNIVLDEMFDRHYIKSFIGKADRTHVYPSSNWTILEKTPIPRQKADSEYDMARYEIFVYYNNRKFWAMIGKCRNVIVFG